MEDKLNIIKLTEKNSIKKIINSFKKYGFAVITEHGIDKNKIDNNFNAWKKFFDSDEKFKYAYNEEVYEGYFSEEKVEIPIGNESRDYKEFAHFYHDNYPLMVKKTHSDLFCNVIDIFHKILNELEAETPKEITDNLPLSFVDLIKGNHKNCLRVNHYPPSIKNNRVRAGAHTDICFMTLLITDNKSGLEILTKENEWIPVPTEYNSIVINIGDQMQEITKGYFKSTYHRVINPENESSNVSRYSMPLFLHIHNHIKLNKHQKTEDFLLEKSKQAGFKHTRE